MNKSAIQLKSRCYCVCYVASYLGSEVTVPSLSTGGSLMESVLFKDTADAAVCVCSSLSSWSQYSSKTLQTLLSVSAHLSPHGVSTLQRHCRRCCLCLLISLLMESVLFKDTADAAVCVWSSLSSWRLIDVPPAFLSRISDLFEETQYIENTHFHTYHHKIVN